MCDSLCCMCCAHMRLAQGVRCQVSHRALLLLDAAQGVVLAVRSHRRPSRPPPPPRAQPPAYKLLPRALARTAHIARALTRTACDRYEDELSLKSPERSDARVRTRLRSPGTRPPPSRPRAAPCHNTSTTTPRVRSATVRRSSAALALPSTPRRARSGKKSVECRTGSAARLVY